MGAQEEVHPGADHPPCLPDQPLSSQEEIGRAHV